MKKLFFLTCTLALLVCCKDNSKDVAPDAVPAKPADSLADDSVSLVQIKKSETPEIASAKDVKNHAPAKVAYSSFGAKITDDKALTKEQMLKKYTTLKKGDTIAVKFKSKINDVCKKKGCWMSLDLAGKETAFVRFKDYGFFMPLNATGSEAIVSGRAFLDVVSVEELKHYAKDGGKSQEEIDKINQPEVTYAFTADGVLLK